MIYLHRFVMFVTTFAIFIQQTTMRPIETSTTTNDENDDDYYEDNISVSGDGGDIKIRSSGYDETNSKCKNGGFNILESDWCACRPEFTGRYCEIEIEPDNRNGCGKYFSVIKTAIY